MTGLREKSRRPVSLNVPQSKLEIAKQTMADPKPDIPGPEVAREPPRGSVAWYLHTISPKEWSVLAALVAAAFLGGATLSRTTFVRELMGVDPPKPPALSSQTSTFVLSAEIATQMQELAKAHTSRLSELNAAYLKEEVNASNNTYPDSWQATHAASAKRIMEAIAEENRSFKAKIEALHTLNPPAVK